MFNKNWMKVISIVLLAVAVLSPQTPCLARDMDHRRDRHDDRHGDRHFYRYRDHPRFGLHFTFLPERSFVVRAGGVRYYYCDGLYYSRIGTDYVLIPPPIGAIVTAIPPEFHAVVINGVTYYTDNGVYYVYTRHGYQVVSQPVMVVQAPPVYVTPSAPAIRAPEDMTSPANTATAPERASEAVAVSPAATAKTPPAEESFQVNIPDKTGGGYTAVTIKRSGTGYVGPQGEYYAEFPKVTQLQAMYGK